MSRPASAATIYRIRAAFPGCVLSVPITGSGDFPDELTRAAEEMGFTDEGEYLYHEELELNLRIWSDRPHFGRCIIKTADEALDQIMEQYQKYAPETTPA